MTPWTRAAPGQRLRCFAHTSRRPLVRRWLHDAEGRLSHEITYDAKADIEYWFDVARDGHKWTEKRTCRRTSCTTGLRPIGM
jgi:hypothetical protein